MPIRAHFDACRRSLIVALTSLINANCGTTSHHSRSVISEKNILSERDGQITFRYRDNQQQNQTRTLDANHFLKLILQHVLPKGFRRVRDYGFLHGNAKQTLKRVQWALQVAAPKIEQRERPTWHCKRCGGDMHIISTYRRRFNSG